jgi:serine/threonine-protein kinase SRPK3
MTPIAQPSCPHNPKPYTLEGQNTVSLDREFIKPRFATEDVEGYCEGGFHPVRVGSLFCGRYFIKGKIGFGGCGTVWWAHDIVQERHVAIKIITATASKKFESFRTFYYLPSGDDMAPHHPGRNHIVRIQFLYMYNVADLSQVKLVRSFWHKGPNGSHLCLVLELAGPTVEDYAKHRPSGGLTLGEIQKMALDTAKALAYLHTNRYVHAGKQAIR